MTKISLCLSLILSLSALPLMAQADDEPTRWAISARMGGITINDNSPDGQDFYLNDDEGNTFHLTGDYYLSRRLVLTGGLYLENDGMMTDAANGIGFKHINMAGIEGGIKYYFFPLKWVVQPHVGAILQTNLLNLSKTTGNGIFVAEQAYPGRRFKMAWDVQGPGLSLCPQIGLDIHLLSTLSLCIDYEYRFGLWGHNRYDVTYIDGPLVNQTSHKRNTWMRSSISVGLKLDFPTRPVSTRAWNNLLWLLQSWISSKAR